MSRLLPLSLLFVLAACGGAKNNSSKAGRMTASQADAVYAEAAAQYRLLMKAVPPGKFPKNYDPRKAAYEWSGSSWWCSGFYPGTLLKLYAHTGDTALYAEALRMLALLEKEKANTRTHDLGFMMHCSFGNALRIAPKPDFTAVLLQSARSLATRFNPAVGCLKSWESKPSDFLVIIDNMMNLELLFWATRESGDSLFYKVAVKHAETTMKNHFRPDGSSYHVLNYDPQTGAVREKKTAQGFADESAWARGQAWGLYGYTLMFRETKDPKYRRQAEAIARFLLSHPRLPADKIPYWDFGAPPSPEPLRDASAGAITAAALFELATYADGEKRKEYVAAAERALRTLASPAYRSAPGANGGFLLSHSVGHRPAGTEVDVSLTYADYYFVEALERYQSLR